MHAELQAFFDEHAQPKHASLRSVSDLASPLLRLNALAKKQMTEFQHLLEQAELAPHDRALDGKLEAMHQTIRHAQGQLEALSALVRELRRDFAQLERYGDEWKAEIAAYETLAAGPALPTS